MSVEKNTNARIQHKHDIEANWKKAINFVPLAGELIIYSDLNKIKIGDDTLTFVANSATPGAKEVKVGSTPNSSEQATNIATWLNAHSALKDDFTIDINDFPKELQHPILTHFLGEYAKLNNIDFGEMLESIHDVKFTIPEKSDYATAIGAALAAK